MKLTVILLSLGTFWFAIDTAYYYGRYKVRIQLADCLLNKSPDYKASDAYWCVLEKETLNETH